MRNLKLTVTVAIIAVLAPVMIANAQSQPTQAARKGGKKTVPPKKQAIIGKAFWEAAMAALDAVDAIPGSTAHEIVWQQAQIEAQKLTQKLRRTASSEPETRAADAISAYLGGAEVCRMVGRTELRFGGNDYGPCLERADAHRSQALQLLGKKAPAS